MAATTITQLLETLPTASNQTAVLEEFKTLLSALPPSSIREVVPEIPLNIIIECLNTNNREQLELCCDVLNRMLSVMSISALLQNFHNDIQDWLTASPLPVKNLCLSLLSKVCPESVPDLVARPAIVKALVKLIGEESLDGSVKANKVLSQLGTSEEGLQVLYSEQVLETLNAVMQKNDTVRFRVFEMVVSISKQSPLALQHSSQAGLLQPLINAVHREDVLLQLAAVELLSDLTMQPHGLQYLDQIGVVSKLEEMIVTLDTNPLANFLLPGLVKFFGGLTRNHPQEVMARFQPFVNTIFESVLQGDPAVQLVVIDTIGFIGSTPEGKMTLGGMEQQMRQCLGQFGRMARDAPNETRNRTLQAISSLLTLQVTDQTPELLALTEHWFRQLGANPFDLIWSITKQPFGDLRHNGFKVMQAIALTPWGQGLMSNSAGFSEYLLDRSTERSKEGKEDKYELVRLIAHSPTTIEVFGRPYYVRLKEFENQGAFFVRVQADVAMESGNS